MSKSTLMYSEKTIERLYSQHRDKIAEIYAKYPYEEFGEPILSMILKYFRISDDRYCYQECCDAGMLAYMYSVHRFSVIDVIFAKAYISKIMKIYIKCALIISDDSKNLCEANNFKCVKVDSEYFRE